MATPLCFQEGQSADSPSLGLNTASILKRLQVDRLGSFLTEAHKRGSLCCSERKLEEPEPGGQASLHPRMLRGAMPSAQLSLGPRCQDG